LSLYATVVTDWITAGAALTALLGAAATLLQGRRIARRNTTYEYVARFTTPEFRELLVDSAGFLACREAPPGTSPDEWRRLDSRERERRQWARWEQLRSSSLRSDHVKAQTILALPNQLEDLAGMYNHNLLDRAIVKTHAEALLEGFWSKSGWWIEQVRRDPNSNTYQDLAKMLPDLRQRQRPQWHRPTDGRIKRSL
jgi:hypothetical protein